jgi:hypothetical protein
VIVMQDFYLDLADQGRRITPRDYLESALQPVDGGGKAIAAKNEVCRQFRLSYSLRTVQEKYFMACSSL